MMMNGFCYLKGQSNKHPASLIAAQGGFLTLHIQLDNESINIQASLSQTQVSDAVGSIPRTITFPDGTIFTPNDPTQLNLYLKQNHRKSWLNRFESSARWIIAGIVVTCAFVLGTYFYGVPWLTNTIAHHMPASVYATAGEQTLYALDKTMFNPSKLPQSQQDAINARFKLMISQTDVSEHGTPQLYFRDWEEVPNAMALANGSIVVTDELVALLKNDDEIDAVIYHELGHVHHEHVMKSLVKSSLVSVGLSLIIGDASSVADTISGGATFAVMMNYSREMETQADEFAAQQLFKQKQSAQALINAFTQLESAEKDTVPDSQVSEWLSSHPNTRARIEHIKQLEKVQHP